ncbi:hypothetical protein ACWGCC_02455 [Streptomyces nigrescens]
MPAPLPPIVVHRPSPFGAIGYASLMWTSVSPTAQWICWKTYAAQDWTTLKKYG